MVIEKLEHNGYEIEIHTDDMPENPREWDKLGTMICFHSRYNMGDNNGVNKDLSDYKSKYFDSWDELEKHIIKNEKPVNMLPIYMYEHGGVTIRTYSFEDRWDSGQIGFIFASRENVIRDYGIKNITVDIRDKVERCLLAEVNEYDQYLKGDVYGYKVFLDGEEYDSCWGYYGLETVMEEAKGICKERKNEDLRRELSKI